MLAVFIFLFSFNQSHEATESIEGKTERVERTSHLTVRVFLISQYGLAGNVIESIILYYNCTIFLLLSVSADNQSNRVTLIECVRFRGRERRINIPQEIGIKYRDFGLLLLEGDTGTRVRSIAHKHMNDAEQINMEIFQQCITGSGKYPITWKT